jgi:hypothetical protein
MVYSKIIDIFHNYDSITLNERGIVMKAFRFIVLITFFVVFISAQAFALNEVFKIETSGTEYCGDYNAIKFNAKTNVDFWVYRQSETNSLISFTPDFQAGTTFPMPFTEYMISNTKSSFTGTAYGENQFFISIAGTITFDKSGTIKGIKGTFIQQNVLHDGCFSSGTLSASKPIATIQP